MIAISLVSHGHGDMVGRLVSQVLACPEVSSLTVTLNIAEKLDLPIDDDRIRVIVNQQPKGFGANQNAAFAACTAPFFCVLNPDIELAHNPFPALLAHLKDEDVALVAPRVLSPLNGEEDSIRTFPTLASLLFKVATGNEGRYELNAQAHATNVDWVAGMFMLFRSSAYRLMNGFDENYFLYYEDVDICTRLHLANFKIRACHDASVVHDARRASRRSLKYLRWHLKSMIRYLWRYRSI
ncbi:MAG: glycosyl transferase [Curvibacter sp. PD_MW3]|nr:MAG: glycosyl transferase [Curvibacter sp. PD_MW3]